MSDVIFKASVFLASGEPESGSRTYEVQYFNSSDMRWQRWMGGLAAQTGNIEANYTPPERGSQDWTQTNEVIYQIFVAGGSPAARLIWIDPNAQADDPPLVLATGGCLFKEGEPTAPWTLDFGSVWIMDGLEVPVESGTGNIQWDFDRAGLMRPAETSTLHPALLAALNETDKFTDYVPGTSTVTVSQGSGGTGTETSSETVQLLQNTVDVQQSMIDKLTLDLAARDATIQNNETERASLETQIASLEGEVAGVQMTASPFNEVYQNIVSEVQTTADNLSSSPYTLANVSIDLKTYVVDDGSGTLKFQPVDAASAAKAKGDAVSSVHLDIVSQGGSVSRDGAAVAPNLIGLTESAARKKLISLGLKLKAVYQSTQNQVVGQAFRQLPAAGEDVALGGEVTVIFAKEKSTLN